MKTAFLFAGQGAQYTGMGKDLCEAFPEIEKIFDIASNELNLDMKALCFSGPEEELMKTENTQPAVLTVDVAIAELLKKENIMPDVVAGLSLGEYGALVEAGVFEFADAVKLVKKRGKYMQETVPLGKGGMAAIIGLERNKVNEIVKQASAKGIVQAANYNYPGQIVVSGEVDAVQEAAVLTKNNGGKAVILPVSAPFHCSMMVPAGEKLAEELKTVKENEIGIPVLSNVTADFYTQDQVKELLIKQVSSSVLWEDCVMKMLEMGVERFVEVGPGSALTGFVKKIMKKTDYKAECHNINNLETFNKFIENNQK